MSVTHFTEELAFSAVKLSRHTVNNGSMARKIEYPIDVTVRTFQVPLLVYSQEIHNSEHDIIYASVETDPSMDFKKWMIYSKDITSGILTMYGMRVACGTSQRLHESKLQPNDSAELRKLPRSAFDSRICEQAALYPNFINVSPFSCSVLMLSGNPVLLNIKGLARQKCPHEV